MSDYGLRWHSSIGGQLAVGVSTDGDGASLTGDGSASGFGLELRTSGFELTLNPDIFVSGRGEDGGRPGAALVGGGVELALMPRTGSPFLNPAIRVAVGGGANISSVGTTPALRAMLEVDIPIIATNLSFGAWLSLAGAYVDGDARFTLGFRGAIPVL